MDVTGLGAPVVGDPEEPGDTVGVLAEGADVGNILQGVLGKVRFEGGFRGLALFLGDEPELPAGGLRQPLGVLHPLAEGDVGHRFLFVSTWELVLRLEEPVLFIGELVQHFDFRHWKQPPISGISVQEPSYP